MPFFTNITEIRKTFPARLVIIFICFTAGIITLSLIYYTVQRKNIITENQNYLTAISELKTGQIEQWHSERLGDAAVIKNNPPLVRSIRQYYNDRGNTVLRKELTHWMESVRSEFDYSGVAIIDTLYNPLIDVSKDGSVKTGSIRKKLEEVLQGDSVIFTDLHKTGDTSEIHLDLLIPLLDPDAADPHPFGIVILRINPNNKLYPLIQSWPTPSKTSETLLLRKDGDSILYLNELRHRKNSALNLRLPLTSENVLGVKVINGFVGVTEGLDYRNIPVMGYLNKIPGMDWYMVTKVDREELLAPLRRQTVYTVIVTLLLIVTNALIFGFFIWNQRVRSYRDQYEKKLVEESLHRTQAILQTAMDQSQAGIVIADAPDGQLSYVNDAGLLIRGGDRESATNGVGIDQYVANWHLLDLDGRPLKADEVPLARAIKYGEKCSREFIIHRGDSDDRIVMANAAPIKDSNGKVISGIAVFLDVTEIRHMEKDLRESENKFKYVFDNSLTGKSITLPSGEITVNSAFSKMLGYTAEELSHTRWQDISFPDDIKMTEDIIGSILSGRNKSAQFIKRYVHKNGSVIWANVGTAIRRDENGDPLYFITSVNDITGLKEGEKKIRESENRFTLAMKASNDGLYDWNLETNDIYYSPGWKKMLGYDDHELPNDFSVWEHSTDQEDVKKSWELQQKLISKKIDRFVMEFKMKHKNGHWVDILSRAEAVFDTDGKAIRIVGTHTDITQRKHAEEEIHKLNAELEQRVIERTAQYEAANKELESFSYSVSHDLRAPLRSIHGYTRILMDEYENKLDVEGKRICGIISSGATQMGALIDDLLSFSRVGRSGLSPSVIDMSSLAADVFTELSSEKEKERTIIKIGRLHKAYADTNLMRLVWNNLISNAIKYSSKKVTSEITIRSVVRGDISVYSIEDNGVGFDMLYVNKLFGVFQRLHSESEFEGNGVGLANVKRIISRHNGKVWAEGEVDKGATFYFSLPLEDKKTNYKT